MQKHIYIKEKDGVFEFFEFDEALDRKQAQPYLIYLKPGRGNSYMLFIKTHDYGIFNHMIYTSIMGKALVDKFKTSMLLYGFTVPSPKEYSDGARFTLR